MSIVDICLDCGNKNTVLLVKFEGLSLLFLSEFEGPPTPYPTQVYVDHSGEKFLSAVLGPNQGDDVEPEGYRCLSGFKPLLGLQCKADVPEDFARFLEADGVLLSQMKGQLNMEVGDWVDT